MRTLTARDVMTADVLSVTRDMTLDEVARFLVEHEISGAPVVDTRGRPIGVVSLVDLARAGSEEEPAGALAHRADLRRPPEALGFGVFDEVEPPEEESDETDEAELAEEEPRRVADVMSGRVVSVSTDAPLAEVARTMLQARHHRLLVTEGGRCVGLISSMDLVRLMAEEPPGAPRA